MRVNGSVIVPGDKSITHRALYLAALTRGRSVLQNALTSLDARSTAGVVRALGATVSALRVGRPLQVVAPPRLREPGKTLNCGNSGTTARLGLGLLAAQPFRTVLSGDQSLRRRPMRRVTEPLERMGAAVEYLSANGVGLPLAVRGGRLRSLTWELPVSSAQIKSALLLAGVTAGVPVRLREPTGRSRDHTERLLRAHHFTVEDQGDGWIRFEPDGRLDPFELAIPGDVSSAAFLVGAATLAQAGELRIEAVGVNPTRRGFLDVLRRMGGSVDERDQRNAHGEPVADLIVRPATLRATVVEAEEIPGLIDEIPLLATLAARAEGTSVFHQVGELRVKESDRLALLATNLRRLGIEARVDANTLSVTGTDRPPKGRVTSERDHRIVMAFAVLAQVEDAAVQLDELASADVSYPGFADALRAIGGRIP